jgi:hypothetical protein
MFSILLLFLVELIICLALWQKNFSKFEPVVDTTKCDVEIVQVGAKAA